MKKIIHTTREGVCGMEKSMKTLSAVIIAAVFALILVVTAPAAAWAEESGIADCPYDFDSNNDGEVDSWFFSDNRNDADNQVYAYLADNGETLVVAGKGATVIDIDSVQPDSAKKVSVTRSSAMGSLKTIRIKEGVTYLGANLTRNTRSVSVELPASLERMNIEVQADGEYYSTFGNAYYDSASKTPFGIAKISVAEGNSSFKMEEGVLFSRDGEILLCYTDEAPSDYVVPSGVKTIAAKAFARTGHLQSIKMNEGLLTIARNAFDITPNITEITIPSTVRNIAYASFTAGEKLSHVTFLMTDYDYWGSPFGTTGPRVVTLAEGLKDIPDKFCENAAGIEIVELPSTTEKIGWRAFQNCVNLKKITKDGVELASLKEFVVPEDSTYSKAFSGCVSLTNFPISIDAPLKEIPSYAFEQTGIVSFSAPTALEKTGNRAFQMCENLNSADFNSGLKNIGEYAFYQCSSLQEVSISGSIESIDEYAFANSGLKNISIVADGDFNLLNNHALSETSPSLIKVGSADGNVNLGSIGGNAGVLRLCGSNINFNRALLMTNPTGASVWHTLDLTGVQTVSSSVSQPAIGDDNRSWIWYLGAKDGESWKNKGIIYVNDSSNQTLVEDSLKAGVAVRQHIDAVTNGGTFPDNMTFEAGILATPQKDGFTFGGWYDNPDFSGDAVTEVGSVESGEAYRAYYAKWIPAYVVTIEGNEFTYTGKAIEPAVTVKYGENVLPSDDYDVAYFNNVDVNDNAYVVIIPNGAQSITGPSFKIVKDENPTIEINVPENWTYGDAGKTVTAIAKTSAGNQITPADVSIKYYSNQACTENETSSLPNAAGTFWVKATLKDTSNHAGKETDAVKVTIAKATPTVDFGITGNAISKTYGDDDFTQSAAVTAPGPSLDPSAFNISYKSNNEEVAIVDENGKVHIISAGEATITAEATPSEQHKGDYNSATASYKLTVNPAGSSTDSAGAGDGSTQENPLKTTYGKTVTLTVTIKQQPVSDIATQSLDSAGANAGTPDKNKVGFYYNGEPLGEFVDYDSVNGTATFEYDTTKQLIPAGLVQMIEVKFGGSNNLQPSEGRLFVEIAKAPQDLMFANPGISQHVGTVSNSLSGAVGAVMYESSDTSVATVDSSGLATIVAPGSTVITASAQETDWFKASSVSYTLTVPEHALGTYVYDNANPEKGHWQECSECDYATNPEAHQFGEWIVTKEATATESGERTQTCTVCGYTATEAIDATGGKSDEGNKADNPGSANTNANNADKANGKDKSTMAATSDATTGVMGIVVVSGVMAFVGAAYAVRRYRKS